MKPIRQSQERIDEKTMKPNLKILYTSHAILLKAGHGIEIIRSIWHGNRVARETSVEKTKEAWNIGRRKRIKRGVRGLNADGGEHERKHCPRGGRGWDGGVSILHRGDNIARRHFKSSVIGAAILSRPPVQSVHRPSPSFLRTSSHVSIALSSRISHISKLQPPLRIVSSYIGSSF